MKPNIINSVEVHPQLSDNGHPVDDALGGWVLVHCGHVKALQEISKYHLKVGHLISVNIPVRKEEGSRTYFLKERDLVAPSLIGIRSLLP